MSSFIWVVTSQISGQTFPEEIEMKLKTRRRCSLGEIVALRKANMSDWLSESHADVAPEAIQVQLAAVTS